MATADAQTAPHSSAVRFQTRCHCQCPYVEDGCCVSYLLAAASRPPPNQRQRRQPAEQQHAGR